MIRTESRSVLAGLAGLALALPLVVVVVPGASAADAAVTTCGELSTALQAGGSVVLGADIGTISALCPPVAVGAGKSVVLDLADHAVYVGTLDPSGGAGLLVPSSSRLEIVGVTGATDDQSGTLAAFGGAGAGIGAEPGTGDAGYIGIRGGSIHGSSATGAGIGGSDAGALIQIFGGRVDGRAPDRAFHPAADSGAGIGGGRAGDSSVDISNAVVRGESWSGAGIGGGSEGNGVVTTWTYDRPLRSDRIDVEGVSERGAGIGGGERGVGSVHFNAGSVVGRSTGPGVGIGDPSGTGTVGIGNWAHVSATSIRSSRTSVLGGSLLLPDGVASATPRPIDNYRQLVPVHLIVRRNGVPVNEPGLTIELLEVGGAPGYFSTVVDGNFAYAWLRPTRTSVAVELDGERKVFSVIANGDQATPVYLDFGRLTLEQRIVTRYLDLVHRMSSDAAIQRIADELRVSTTTVRFWLRRAGELG
ncbi:MAG TPA: hypothetical protein VNT50_13370 [Microbacterium sp.]|uniref:hypothetical protein n=1 Tax=Microbacterium sp. TaxID=51671 RepID=UPI002C88623A|nr:hypothetical protein [Microbacterium sp.]HWI32468.1 hypothetical protein [Microbacterium sp.]